MQKYQKPDRKYQKETSFDAILHTTPVAREAAEFYKTRRLPALAFPTHFKEKRSPQNTESDVQKSQEIELLAKCTKQDERRQQTSFER